MKFVVPFSLGRKQRETRLHALTVPRTSSNYTLEMFSLFIGAAIIGGGVGLFFLGQSENPKLARGRLFRVRIVELPAG